MGRSSPRPILLEVEASAGYVTPPSDVSIAGVRAGERPTLKRSGVLRPAPHNCLQVPDFRDADLSRSTDHRLTGSGAEPDGWRGSIERGPAGLGPPRTTHVAAPPLLSFRYLHDEEG